MASLRDIRTRIKSVKNTAQITGAMQLVAASKMKRAQDIAQKGRPYALLLASMIGSIKHHLDEDGVACRHKLLRPREVTRRGILVISTDKGLCGGLNANLFRMVAEACPRATPACYYVIGRKASQFVTRSGRTLKAEFSVSDQVHFHEVRPVIEHMVEQYLADEIDTIEIAYPRFRNTLVQTPVLFPMLPIQDLTETVNGVLAENKLTPMDLKDMRHMEFEPEPADLVGKLLKVYINFIIYQSTLQARASEHSARMVAMKGATDNARKLVGNLTLAYNKARQAKITQEIIEIAASVGSQQ